MRGSERSNSGAEAMHLVTNTGAFIFSPRKLREGLEECLRTRIGSGCEDDTNWSRRWPEFVMICGPVWACRICILRACVHLLCRFVLGGGAPASHEFAGCDAQTGVQAVSVSFPAAQSAKALDGRLLLLLSNDPSEEPRMQIDDTPKSQMVFGVTVDGMEAGTEREGG